jgi:dihydrolipoamide dehydrogenase
VEADNYILATGSKPKDLGSLKIDNRYIFNSDGFCHNPKLGDNILIIGGGYIGCELASFYNSLGAKVTIIDIASTLLPGKDKDLVKTLAREFSKRGIEVLTAHKLKAADVDDGKVKITAEDLNGGRELSRKFSLAIVAVGREANFANLNLAATAVAEDKGFIKVDSNFCASASGIYAIGDLINTPMLAHIAYKEAAAVTDFILRGKTPSIDYGLTPEVIFSQPQLATFGLSETQASEKDIEVEVRKSFFRTNAKAHIAGEPAGFAKLILDRDNQQLLGASIVGAEATELIHTLIAIANSGQSAEVAKKIIYAHPTLSEVFSSDI